MHYLRSQRDPLFSKLGFFSLVYLEWILENLSIRFHESVFSVSTEARTTMEVDHKLGSIDRVIIFDASETATYSPLSPSHRVYKVCPASSNGLLPWPSCARSVSDPRVLTLTPFYRKSHFHDRRSIHASRSRKKGVKIARFATRTLVWIDCRCGKFLEPFLDPFLLENFWKFKSIKGVGQFCLKKKIN